MASNDEQSVVTVESPTKSGPTTPTNTSESTTTGPTNREVLSKEIATGMGRVKVHIQGKSDHRDRWIRKLVEVIK